jgi:hypothetical protein
MARPRNLAGYWLHRDNDDPKQEASAMEGDDVRRVRIALEPDERIEVRARAQDGLVAVTDRRLAVAANDRLVLDIPFDRLRRIQFDIERARPATLVVVPEHPTDQPQVLTIPPEEYRAVAEALAIVGQRIINLP